MKRLKEADSAQNKGNLFILSDISVQIQLVQLAENADELASATKDLRRLIIEAIELYEKLEAPKIP